MEKCEFYKDCPGACENCDCKKMQGCKLLNQAIELSNKLPLDTIESLKAVKAAEENSRRFCHIT